MNTFHTPVLLNESINYLNVREGGKYIDATVGGGGHTLAILKRGGIVLGIDQDSEAINYVQSQIPKKYKNKIILVKGNFRNIDKIALTKKFNKVSGILFDLGVSTYQLEKEERGFSFKRGGPLDMRMDRQIPTSAFKLINQESGEFLYEIFRKFGEEPLGRPIAKAIIKDRTHGPITKTSQLTKIVEEVYHRFGLKTKIHPSTRVFQAIRIAVNQELAALKEGLFKAIELLDKGGRILVISYHSLEDRIVKLKMKSEKLKIIIKKPVRPGWEEIRQNPRSRSAKLRVAEKR